MIIRNLNRLRLIAVTVICLFLVVFSLKSLSDPLQVQKLIADGNLQEALSLTNSELAKDSENLSYQFLKGLILTRQEKLELARDVFIGITLKHPELPEPYNNLAVIYASMGDFDKARQALEQAINTHPAYATAHENLGDIYAKLASQAYNQALELDKENNTAKTKLSLVNELFSAPGSGGELPVQLADTTAADDRQRQLRDKQEAERKIAEQGQLRDKQEAERKIVEQRQLREKQEAERKLAEQQLLREKQQAERKLVEQQQLREKQEAERKLAEQQLLREKQEAERKLVEQQQLREKQETEQRIAEQQLLREKQETERKLAEQQLLREKQEAERKLAEQQLLREKQEVERKLAEQQQLREKQELAEQQQLREKQVAEPKQAEQQQLRLQDEQQIVSAVKQGVIDWSSAWSARDVNTYLSLYATDFIPPDGRSLEQWRLLRQKRLGQSGAIKVTIADLVVEMLGPERARATFTQNYQSDNYNDRVKKTLLMKLDNNRWLITGEQTN